MSRQPWTEEYLWDDSSAEATAAPWCAPAEPGDSATESEPEPPSPDYELPEPVDLSWQEHGACSVVDEKGRQIYNDKDFYLENVYARNSPEYRVALAKAKAVCAGCDVRGTCLQFAIDHHINGGVWGGETYWQRRARRYPRRRVNGRLTYIKEGDENVIPEER